MQGVGRKKCMVDGGWSGEDGECHPLTCPALNQPANGRVEPQSCITGNESTITCVQEGDLDVGTTCPLACLLV